MAKARKFSPEFKAQVALEIITGKKTLAQASQHYQIKGRVLSRWQAQFLEGASAIFESGQPAEQKRLQERIAELERLAAKQALHLEIAQKANHYLKSLPPEDESQRKR